MRTFFLLLSTLFACPYLFAQSASAPPVVYENATLPEDRKQAWEMLRAANGLNGDALQPFHLTFHYRTYDAYGKPNREGTGEYAWANPNRWFERLTEGGKTWSFLKTENGSYAPRGESENPPYPASLIVGEYLNPLGDTEGSKKLPSAFNEQFLGTTPHSCFSMVRPDHAVTSGAEFSTEDGKSSDLMRACTVPGRPILLMRQGDYTVFFEDSMAFQHRIVAKRILVRDGRDAVIDIDLDRLGALDEKAVKLLETSGGAVPLPPTSEGSLVPAHLLKKVDPQYPLIAKTKGIQGTVRLAATVGKDGKLNDITLLHSPAAELSFSAIDALKQFVYSPYLFNGAPVDGAIQVNVDFHRD